MKDFRSFPIKLMIVLVGLFNSFLLNNVLMPCITALMVVEWSVLSLLKCFLEDRPLNLVILGLNVREDQTGPL